MIRSGAVFLAVFGSLLFAAAGCTSDPLSTTYRRTVDGREVKVTFPRSPYGRYQALRGGEPPMEEADTFGVMRPALRSRLQPMDRP